MSFQTNVIYCGDCQEVLRRFPEGCVDLIYLDPPFFSKKQYEILWKDGYELRAFEDRWKGGIQNYVAWMRSKLRECHRVLKDTGSLYLHCDWHAGHYLKVLMDKIFGVNRLVNDLVWKRTAAHTGEGEIEKFGTVHDNILFYTKTEQYTFNPQYRPHSEAYIKKYYRHVDEDGRRWMADNLTGAGVRHGETGKPWRGIDPSERGRHWAFPVDKLEELAKEGRIHFPKKRGGVPRYKRYLDELPGRLVQDIWTDIKPISAHSKERLGYPTQKPEELLERIIMASSNPTDIVLDPFCGCGTAIAVAHKLGRRWIGIDVSPTACKLMEKRMRSLRARGFKVIGLPRTINDLKKLQPFEFQNWVIEKLYARVSPRKVGDMGIDGYYMDGTPIQVKQSEDVGRNVVDNFETAIQRMDKKKGVIVAFGFTKGAHEEVARAKNEQSLEIILKTVQEILKET